MSKYSFTRFSILLLASSLLASNLFSSLAYSAQDKSPVVMKDLDGHFPFQPPATLEAWESRASQVRQQLIVSLGLDPMPRLPQLQPQIHSKQTCDGYTVENVFFESFPGLFVTGNLYRPIPSPGKSQGQVPALLCPHGHWANARFYDAAPNEVNRLLAKGEERFLNAARNHIQARCVQLARMGCVVFHWDMLGNADSQQISMQRAHGFRAPSEDEQSTDQSWLLYSPQAEGHAQSVMGIQTLHTLRAIDFVLTLPEVDPNRIGITGASGGGTQTFIAAAIDPRIQLAFPAVMVSTGMQGGCTCENACGLRVDTGNVEIAALFAPKPLAMTAADDWTKTMPRDGFPELQKLYGLYQATDRVALFPSLHFGHNYNHVSRVSMYNWVNHHFHLGLPEPVLERDFEYLGQDSLSVWNQQFPAPPSGLLVERSILGWWHQDAQAQLLTGNPETIRANLQRGWDTLLAPTKRRQAETKIDGKPDLKLSLPQGDVAIWSPPQSQAKIQRLWIDCQSSTSSLESAYEHANQLQSQAHQDKLANNREWGRFQAMLVGATQPLVANPRRSAAYSYGYNPPQPLRLAALLAAALDSQSKQHGVQFELWADTLPLEAIAAAYLAPHAVHRLVLLDNGQRLADAKDIDAVDFVPGALRYCDWPGLVAVSHSTPTLILRDPAGKKRGDWDRLQKAGLLKHVTFQDR